MAPLERFLDLLREDKGREKIIRTATEYAAKAAPIVKTIQSEYEDVDVAKLAVKAVAVAQKIRQFTPSMQVMGKSFADSAKIFAAFSSMAAAAGIGGNIVLTYQGIKALQIIDARLKDMAASLAAQTALTAQKDFPQYVHNMIRERIMQTSSDADYKHWFFVYHPDNDWYPAFYHLMQEKPVGPAFCGYTNQIDTAFVFMLAARRRLIKKQQRAQRKEKYPDTRPIRLHLLIPAYQPILILEALKIPESIGDFVIEGRINSNRPFVWFNLPEEQRHYVQDIGHFVPPPQGLASRALIALGLADAPAKLGDRRVLGQRQGSIGIDEENSDSDEEEDEKEKEAQHATPIQHQHRRRHDKSHRNSSTTDSRKWSTQVKRT
ncbi:hypothetical protein GGS21DRAFT_247243 [Xylaria nigripes]|nr:hypothetical protein GGS21DRAFT_247243 [Xylaria nigripes]